MTDVTYLSIRSFFAELAAQGVTDVLVSPGSRSTPLAISAHREPGLNVSIHLDERSAGFWALGMAKATRRPVALVCTSGTAAANYLPAVIEAHYSEVPLLVLTADRPPELRDRGAGQTIDQRHNSRPQMQRVQQQQLGDQLEMQLGLTPRIDS